MRLRVVLLSTLVAAAIQAAAPAARAQLVDRVAAVVNDEAITARDVDSRLRLALASSQLPDSPDARKRVLPQLIRKMIDERLQVQEAARLGVTLTSADVDSGIAMLERQNRIPPGSLLQGLARQGVDPAVVREQIRADLTWLRLVQRKVVPQIRISAEEVRDRLDGLLQRQGLREVLAAEIFLPVEQAAQDEEIRTLGEKLIEGLHKGTPFSALARQFSRAVTAANGGQMGWVSEGMIDPDVAAMLAPLTKGGISPLTRTAGGYHIVTVLAERIIGQTINPEDSTVTVAKLLLPIPKDAPPKAQLMAQASGMTRGAQSCAALDQIAAKAGTAQPVRIGPKRIAELSADIRPIVADFTANQISAPVDDPQGLAVYMVCSRQDAMVAQPPTEDAIRNQIEDERRDMLSRRYIRDLRRAAFVDIRM